MRVLVTGARAPVALEWARVLSSVGWSVGVADSVTFPLARSARCVARTYRLPSPRQDPPAWGRALGEAVRDFGATLLLPTCEEVFYLARQLEHLPSSCRVAVADFTTLEALHHKGRFAELSQKLPAPAPETHALVDRRAVADFLDESRSWVFKPVYSRFGRRALLGPSRAQLSRIEPSPTSPWIAQRFVSGIEYSSYSILDRGRLCAHADYRPLYRVGQGSGMFVQSTAIPVIREFVEAFGAVTSFSGQVGFDFIQDRRERLHVLECNPRATSGLHLLADQPKRLAEALIKQPATPLQAPRGARAMVGMAMMTLGTAQYGWRSTRFWRDLLSTRDVMSAGGDFRPWIMQLAGLGEALARAAVQRHGLLSAATRDIEWDGPSDV